MSTHDERVAAGIAYAFSRLTPAWRKTAHDLIAEQGSDQQTVCRVLAAVVALQAREKEATTNEHHTTPAQADTNGAPGREEEAGQAAPAPALPLPRQHPTHPRHRAKDN